MGLKKQKYLVFNFVKPLLKSLGKFFSLSSHTHIHTHINTLLPLHNTVLSSFTTVCVSFYLKRRVGPVVTMHTHTAHTSLIAELKKK